MTRNNGAARRPFLGRWRITATELWTADDLDLLGPAHLTLGRDGQGRLTFLAIEAGLDYRVVPRDGVAAVEFSFSGSDEGDLISGRGWAVLRGEQLQGRIFVHHGDDSGFTACRSESVAAPHHRKRGA
jgi:hypothetical protein